jgi:hypothetical protein
MALYVGFKLKALPYDNPVVVTVVVEVVKLISFMFVWAKIHILFVQLELPE